MVTDRDALSLPYEFAGRWQTVGSHRGKQKNKSAQSAGPTFSQHFPTQVSPHFIQLDPIYYGLGLGIR